MIRLAIFLAIVLLVVYALWRALQWLVKNQVKIRVTRPPTDKEIVFFTVAMQVLRALFRLFLRR